MTDYLTDNPHFEIVEPRVSVGTDRIAWLKMRRTGLGSSDCSAVMQPYISDVKSYKSRWELWRDKTGRVPLEDEGTNRFLYWGSRMEELTRPEVAKVYDIDIVQLPMIRSKVRPWQLADVDGMTEDGGVVELKNASAWLAHEWDDQVPDHAELQCAHAMAVTGAPYAIVAGLIGGNDFRHQIVYRSDKLISLINEREEEFWTEHVLADVEPEIDGSDGTYRAILASGAPAEEMRVLTPEEACTASVWIAQYEDGQQLEKDGKSQKNTARNNLLRMMDGAPGLMDQDEQELVRLKGGTYAWKRFETDHPEIADSTRRKVDVLDTDAVKIEHPDLAKQYQSKSLHIPKGK